MKILITGIHGFVGSNLVEALYKEHTIYGMDIFFPSKNGVKKTFRWEDLDHGDIPEVDAIIHLAGKAHDTKKQVKADEYFKINTDLTKKIYDYFVNHHIKKFIFFSSIKAAADYAGDNILTEDIHPTPHGPYGESKIAAEQYIKEHISEHTYILRPCMIHGPGNKGNLNLLYHVVSKGIPWPLGNFENKRTFTSIDNLCFVIKGILKNNIDSGIYNMNDDEAISTNELIDIICSTLGKKVHIWNIPKSLISMIAKIGDVVHLPLNSERLEKLTENYISSNEKIKKALGISHMPVRAKDGLIKTINSFSQ